MGLSKTGVSFAPYLTVVETIIVYFSLPVTVTEKQSASGLVAVKLSNSGDRHQSYWSGARLQAFPRRAVISESFREGCIKKDTEIHCITRILNSDVKSLI